MAGELEKRKLSREIDDFVNHEILNLKNIDFTYYIKGTLLESGTRTLALTIYIDTTNKMGYRISLMIHLINKLLLNLLIITSAPH